MISIIETYLKEEQRMEEEWDEWYWFEDEDEEEDNSDETHSS